MAEKADFESLGGRLMLERFSKVFYDEVYKDPWLGAFFQDIPQDFIERQQVDFLQESLGGPKAYVGKRPKQVHQHMFITDELFEHRNRMVERALRAVDAPEELIERVLKIDNAFKKQLVKNSVDECEKRFPSDEILNFPAC